MQGAVQGLCEGRENDFQGEEMKVGHMGIYFRKSTEEEKRRAAEEQTYRAERLQQMLERAFEQIHCDQCGKFLCYAYDFDLNGNAFFCGECRNRK
jgi:hypothetical protein